MRDTLGFLQRTLWQAVKETLSDIWSSPLKFVAWLSALSAVLAVWWIGWSPTFPTSTIAAAMVLVLPLFGSVFWKLFSIPARLDASHRSEARGLDPDGVLFELQPAMGGMILQAFPKLRSRSDTAAFIQLVESETVVEGAALPAYRPARAPAQIISGQTAQIGLPAVLLTEFRGTSIEREVPGWTQAVVAYGPEAERLERAIYFRYEFRLPMIMNDPNLRKDCAATVDEARFAMLTEVKRGTKDDLVRHSRGRLYSQG